MTFKFENKLTLTHHLCFHYNQCTDFQPEEELQYQLISGGVALEISHHHHPSARHPDQH